MLIGARLSQDRMEGRHDRRSQVAHQAEHMAARRAPEDAVLVLETDDVGIGEIQEVGRAEIGVNLLLLDLEPRLRRIVVSLREIVDRDHEAIGPRVLRGDRRAEVIGEGRDTAFPRQVVTDESDLLNLTVSFHRLAREAGSSRGRKVFLVVDPPTREPTSPWRSGEERADGPHPGHSLIRSIDSDQWTHRSTGRIPNEASAGTPVDPDGPRRVKSALRGPS